MQLGAYKVQNKLSQLGVWVGGMLDEMKIRLTQPQVELEFGNKSVPKMPLWQNKRLHRFDPTYPIILQNRLQNDCIRMEFV